MLGYLLSGATLWANGLQVAPTSLNISADHQATELWLSSTAQIDNPPPMTAQIRVFKWIQTENKDRLISTSDIVVSPPFVTITKKVAQLIRIVRSQENKIVNQKNPSDEISYRIIVDEIPTQDTHTPGLQFVMHYSIPLFVQPQSAKNQVIQLSKENLAWHFVKKDNKVLLQVINNGPIHIQLMDVNFSNKTTTKNISHGLLGYVLPHSQMEWKTNLKPENILSGGMISLTLNGKEHVTVPITTQ